MTIRTGLVAVALAGVAAAMAPIGQAEAGAREAGTWLVRGGIANINPKSDNLALDKDLVVAVDDAWGITFSGSYFLSSHFAVELLLALPYTHDIDLETPEGSLKIGETKHLKVVRQFAIMTVVWGIVGMLVGVIIAAQLVWPALNLSELGEWFHFGRLRPVAHQCGDLRLRRLRAVCDLVLFRRPAHLPCRPCSPRLPPSPSGAGRR
jgi:hypothetical protein